MIRLILKEDIEILNKKYNLNLSYLESLLNNMTEYMYISINNEIDGYMICLDDGNSINIKEVIGNKDDFLKHLLFNSNKDIYSDIFIDGFEKVGNKFIKRFERFKVNNIDIIEYYEQDNEFKNKLLNQINEPLWNGARFLYNKIIKNELVNGKVYIVYDKDRDHIISFASLSDDDEIVDTDLKPWIGCVYTFRPYRGNRYSQILINHILDKAKENKINYVYLSSDHQGLYEKYGFKKIGMMKRTEGYETQVYSIKLDNNGM